MSKFKSIIDSEVPTLVDFHATWCGPCKALAPTLERLKKAKGSELRVIKIDVDKNQALAAQFKVRSVPTLMFFHKGKTIWRQSGAMDFKTLVYKTKL